MVLTTKMWLKNVLQAWQWPASTIKIKGKYLMNSTKNTITITTKTNNNYHYYNELMYVCTRMYYIYHNNLNI